jgi:hypothetical protein
MVRMMASVVVVDDDPIFAAYAAVFWSSRGIMSLSPQKGTKP